MAKLSTFPGVDITGNTDCTAAIQAAFNSGASEIEYDDIYQFQQGAIDIPNTTVRRVVGAGLIKQRVGGMSRIFQGSNLDDVRLEGLRIKGDYLPGQTTSFSQNNGMVFMSSIGVRVLSCTMTNIQNIAVHLMGCEASKVDDLRIENCGLGIYVRGGKTQTITNNKIKDTLFDESVFTIAISLESTDGHEYGVPSMTIIDRNMIHGYRNAQGIMAHSCTDMISGINIVEGSLIGLSVNPFNTTDDVSRIVMLGNISSGPVSFSGSMDGNENIICQGGPASGGGMTPRITDLVIGSNVTSNGNRAEGGVNQGAIRLGYTKRSTVVGNTLCASKGNAIVLSSDEQLVNVHGNVMDEVLENGSQQNGVLCVTGGVSGYIGDNVIANMTGTNAVGVKANGSNPNLHVNSDNTTNVTTIESGSWGEEKRPSRTVYSGDTIDLSNVEVIYIAHTIPTTINYWTGAVRGKEYQLIFLTDKVTIGRSNAWLDGSAAFTGGFDDVMEIIGRTSTSVQQASTSSVNG